MATVPNPNLTAKICLRRNFCLRILFLRKNKIRKQKFLRKQILAVKFGLGTVAILAQGVLTEASWIPTEMILGFASRYACLGDLDKWAASRLQVACK